MPDMDIGPVRLIAPAKLTTSLRVTGVRDDGYHLIDAEMVSLDLADVVEIEELDEGVESSVSYIDASSADPLDVGPDDLVARALAAVDRRARVSVTKRIAAGAGLGGGSADAAAILRWARCLDPLEASRLGADVAFCVLGGRARVTGIGEILEPLPYVERVFTLVTPPIHCSTPAVYRAWDEMGGPRGDHGNDLEPAALVVSPALARWRDELADAVGQRPRLAGSGSTWFVEGAHPAPGRVVTTTIPAAVL